MARKDWPKLYIVFFLGGGWAVLKDFTYNLVGFVHGFEQGYKVAGELPL